MSAENAAQLIGAAQAIMQAMVDHELEPWDDTPEEFEQRIRTFRYTA